MKFILLFIKLTGDLFFGNSMSVSPLVCLKVKLYRLAFVVLQLFVYITKAHLFREAFGSVIE